jgi:MATE family multidrug resistance protein
MILAGIVLLVIPRPLIELFTHDPEVLAVGPSLPGIAAAFQIFDGIQTVATGSLRGLGETRTPMVANFIGYWILGLPLGFVLCFVFRWGIYGTWIGLTLALVIISIILLRRWYLDSARVSAA